MTRLMLARSIVAMSVVIVFSFVFVSFASAWDATASCTTVHLEAGRDHVLGRTVIVYSDSTRDELNITTRRFNVDNAGPHGNVVRVKFANGEARDLGAPVGCTATTTTTPAPTTVPATAAPTPTTVAAPPTTVVAPVTVAPAPQELPHTGPTSPMLVIVGMAAVVLGLAGICVVGNRRVS